MTARMKHGLATVVACAMLTGCSGGSSDAGKTTSTTTSTSTSSTTSSTTTSSTSTTTSASPTSNATYAGAPGVPEAAKYKTDAGAIAFAKYYLETVNKVGQQPKVGVLEPLALPSCKTCKAQQDTVSSLVTDHQRFAGPQLQVHDGTRLPGQSQSVISVVVDQPSNKILDSSGSSVEEFEPMGRATAVFTLTWADGWRIAKLQQGSE